MIPWGPFPELARRLGGAAPGLERAEELGGLWGLPVPGWPATLPGPRPQPRPPASFRELAARSVRWLLRRRPAAVRRMEPEELNRLLLRCHLWLGLRNLRSIAPLFGPGAEDLPVGAFAVSPKALAWTLSAMDFAERRRRALPPARYAPGAGDPLGDALSLHLHVEDLVERAASRLRISPSPALPWRRPGGLRKASFLRVYPLLEQRQEDRAGSAWKQGIDAFIAASPLTQLVYLDVLGKLPAPELLDGLLRPGPTSTAPGFNSEVGWRELWLSLLARSLVGAVLSPPPLEERWRAAEAREREPAPAVQPLAGSTESAAVLRSQLEAQYLQRLALLAGLFRPPANSGRTAPVYFHLRMLDMLVRHLVTTSGEAMEEQWHSGGESSGRSRTSDALLGEASAPRKALAAALLGARETPPSGQEWRGHLDALLFPGIPDPEEVARQTGVSHSSARWLIERWSDERRAVELPFSSLYDQGEAPATLAETWKVQLVT